MLDHSTTEIVAIEGSRFAKLLGTTDGTPEIWDTIVFENDEFLVAPTLGSIIPNWLLVIPKRPAINFRDNLQVTMRTGVSHLLSEIANVFDERQFLWFEHGARAPGSTVGCGTDYAHLHVLLSPPFNLDEFKASVFQLRPSWNESPTSLSHVGLDRVCEYYVFGDHLNSFRLDGVLDPESQFFRKIVASLVGQGGNWNYRNHPNAGNARLTVELLANRARDVMHVSKSQQRA